VITPPGQSRRIALPQPTVHVTPAPQCTVQPALPLHPTLQSPWHVASQPPGPVHPTFAPAPTSNVHAPEPVHETWQFTSHVASHVPEPVQPIAQLSSQFAAQGAAPRHVHAVPAQSAGLLVSGCAEAASVSSVVSFAHAATFIAQRRPRTKRMPPA
jgi:hypothetical protein